MSSPANCWGHRCGEWKISALTSRGSGVALITGGSRGIGAAAAMRLADDGFDICLSYQSDGAAAATAVAAVQARGRRAVAVKADVSCEADVTRLFDTCDAEMGPLRVLVNNAGIVAQQARLDEIDLQRFERVFAVNVTGTFLCCRAASRRMSSRYGGAGGSIVNVSSIAPRLGSPNEYVDYAALLPADNRTG